MKCVACGKPAETKYNTGAKDEDVCKDCKKMFARIDWRLLGYKRKSNKNRLTNINRYDSMLIDK